MADITLAVWITHSETNLSLVRGMVTELENAGALDLAQVRILAVTPGQTAVDVLGKVYLAEDIPASGILVLAEAEDE